MEFQVGLPGASSKMLFKIDGDKTIEDLTKELRKMFFSSVNHSQNISYWYRSPGGELRQLANPSSRKTLQSSKLKNGDFIFIELENSQETQVASSQISSNVLILNLCLIPFDTDRTVPLEINESATLEDLKVRIFDLFNTPANQNPLFFRQGDAWTQYSKKRNNLTLKENRFTSNGTISLPISENTDEQSYVPGLCGLLNLENTCFLNSSLQCLAHIPIFTRYLRNCQNNRRSGVVDEYLKLFQQIWSGKNELIKPVRLLDNIIRNLPQYNNYSQHDAPEFLCAFLELIKKEFPDNNNPIKRLFFSQGQSEVTCERCQRTTIVPTSINFLPISMNDYARLNTRLIKSNGEQVPICLLTESALVTGKDFIDCFLNHYRHIVPEKSLRIIELSSNEIVRAFNDDDSVNGLAQEIAFIEYPQTNRQTMCIRCEFHRRDTGQSFRPPVFFICKKMPICYIDIEEQIEQIYAHLCSSANLSVDDFSIFPILQNRNSPQNSMERAPEQTYDDIKCVRIVVKPEPVRLYTEFFRTMRYIDDSYLISLIHDFFSADTVEGSYECSPCSQSTRAQQMMRLHFPLPSILIIQLKRISFDGQHGRKISRLIRFPFQELELKDYIVEANNNQQLRSQSTLYDLVAVCNHFGDLESGHYTTYAKYEPDKNWYSFDDNIVKMIAEPEAVISKNAYILFYVKRETK